MKKIYFLFLLCSALRAFTQISPGALAPDFTVQDIVGNTRHLYGELDSGKTVIMHCFTAWDSYAWEYYQQQVLEAFNALYGPQGNGSVVVWRVECETQNDLAQLQGPASLTGSYATDTQGDWLSESELPLIDDSTLAAGFDLPYVPVIIIVCPDRVVRFANQISIGNLANLVFQNSCPPISQGFDPALVSATTSVTCGSNLVDVQVVLKNLGTDTLFNASIEIGGVASSQTYNWQGQLSSYRSDTLSLNSLELLSDGFIELSIMDVNANYSNDTLYVRGEVGLSTQLIRLELALDAYPEEVSWEIRNAADSVIYNGGGYEIDYEYINHVFQLPTIGCYNFYLNDTRGDGLHGSQYGGFDGFCKLYSMTDSSTVEEEMFHYDGSYNLSSIINSPSFLQFSFEAGSALATIEPAIQSWSVYPNPANQDLFIWSPTSDFEYMGLLYDMTGRVVSQFNRRKGDKITPIDVSSLPGGMYFLHITTDNAQSRIPILVQHP